MILREILDFTIDTVAGLVGNDQVTEALKLVLPHVIELAEVDRLDARARAEVQAAIDSTLRTAGLV